VRTICQLKLEEGQADRWKAMEGRTGFWTRADIFLSRVNERERRVSTYGRERESMPDDVQNRIERDEGRGEGREEGGKAGKRREMEGNPTRSEDGRRGQTTSPREPCQPSRLLASTQLLRAAHRRHMRVVCGKRRGGWREGGRRKEGSERGWGKREQRTRRELTRSLPPAQARRRE
jgi:hypothetical protein